MTHLPLDELGDVDTAARDPHVLGCVRCQRAVAEQRAVRNLLAALPAPSAAPSDVVRALEATLRGLTPAAPATAAAVTVVPLSAARSRRAARWRERTPGLLAAAAAVVLATGLGGLILRGGGNSGAATSAGASAELRTGAARAAAPLAAVASGTAYTKARLTTQVQALLADRPVPVPGAGPSAPRGLLATPAGVSDCTRALGATGAPLAVDLATFDGSPAAIFVLPAAGGGREVWVVSPSCRPGADGTQYFTRLP